VTITVSGSSTPGSDAAGSQEVASLCCYLQSRSHPYVGFSVDGDLKLRVFSSNMPQTHQHECIDNELTLEQMLPNLSRMVFNGDSYVLAITLVASVFQLIQTPWLKKSWSKRSIIFIRVRDDGVANSVDIKYPILMEEFMPPLPPTQSSNESDQIILLALGIMLLEIASGTSIDVVRKSEDLGIFSTPNNKTDHNTALRWLFDLDQNGNLSKAFSEAITTCLQAYINPRASLLDSEFDNMLENKVLIPLQEEMEILTGIAI
jgi:hypothetical protein